MTEKSTPYFYRANGKVLLTAEYFVLDGALALALPTRLGQSMSVFPTDRPGRLHWRSYEADGSIWFDASFELPDMTYAEGNHEETGRRLERILREVSRQRPAFWDPNIGWRVECRLDFPRRWGLGSSSTLLTLIGQWTESDPFQLLEASFGGSGYDLACARSAGPILYQRREDRPHFVTFPFFPPFHRQLYFVYLGKKQDTREGIARYRERVVEQPDLLERSTRLTGEIIQARNLVEFEYKIREHEKLISETLDLPRARDLYFPDFWGEVKSLGAWGGDFVLLTSPRSEAVTRRYLLRLGFEVVFGYEEFIIPLPG